jgi:hypothetical protein
MQPGVKRAVPMGILGFLIGALIVILLRAAQGLTPMWDVGVGIVMGTIFSAAFFVWGIGAFDPRLSVHGEEEEHHHHEPEPEKPIAILSSSMWQITFLLILAMIVTVFLVAVGPTLTTTDDPGSSVKAIGMTNIELFGEEITLSYLTAFVIFVIWMLLSLGIAAGLIAFVVSFLSRNVRAVQAEAKAGGAKAAATLPAPAPAATTERRAPRALRRVGTFAGRLADRLRPVQNVVSDDPGSRSIVKKGD